MNMHDNFPSTVDAALECAARGWHVFPARIEGPQKKFFKSAEYSGGRRWGATIDPEEIRRDWLRWPDALLGIVTGPLSGCFVIEADTLDGHGVDGTGNLVALIEEHGEIPDTIEAKSPSESWHLYFRWPEGLDIRNSAGLIAPGIDVRGDGGMVIAPPSYRADKGGAYRWINPPGFFDLGDCPQWLLDRAMKPQNLPGSSAKASGFKIDTGGTGWGNATSAEVSELLLYIDPDSGGYGQWCDVLMALHDHTNGSAEGIALAEEWSARGNKYKPNEAAAKWLTFQLGGGIGIGTIAALAREGGADLSEIARRHRAATNKPRSPEANTSDGAPRPNLPDDIDLSHDALASDLGKRSFNCDAKHVATWGKWLFWTGARWEVDDRLDYLTRTRDFLRSRADEIIEWTERKAAGEDARNGEGAGDKMRAWAKAEARTLRSKTTVAAVESLARSNPASVARADAFDADLMLLGTPDGTVDLRDGQVRPAKPGDLLTKLTTCTPSEPGTHPSRWLAFLHEIFMGDPEVIAFIQRAAGYALTGLTTEHKLLFLYGTGRNGKSVFLNTLTHIWGDYARRAAAETFLNSRGEKHATGIAGLQGARLVVGSELPKGKTWDESVIKDLTGGDRMSARYMRGDFFDFDPQMTLMIAGNNMPSFRGVDEAIRARVVLVPFLVTIPPERRDKSLSDKLRAEGPAILRWAIDGALAWQRIGLAVPASVAAASDTYMDDEDTLGQFLADETESDPHAFTTTTDLHQRFTFWCQQQGLTAWTLRTLQKELKTRGYQDVRRNHGRGFIGLRPR